MNLVKFSRAGVSGALLVCSGCIAVYAALVPAQPKQNAAQKARFTKEVLPVAKKLCLGCHSGKSASGSYRLDQLIAKDPLANAASWKKALARIGDKSMPPSGATPLSSAQRNSVVRALSDLIGDQECRIVAPGRVTVRRLNRAEYDNTIRDLLGVDLKLSDDFPSDDVGHGFDNIGEVLSVSPLLVEKYLDAAEQAATTAIINFQPRAIRLSGDGMGDSAGQNMREDGARVMFAASEVGGDFEFPKDGRYVVRVRAWGQQAGPEQCKMAIRVEARTIDTVEVRATEASPQIYELQFDAKRGTKRISTAFKNDYYEPSAPNPRDRDRNLIVGWIELVGPLDDQRTLPQSHRRIIPQSPIAGEERAYARQILMKFAARAYRRPPTTSEIDRLMACFDLAAREKETFERGIQLAVTGALVSPQFLFRMESSSPRMLNGYEIASRLSYFLWSSMPDDALFAAAASGALSKPEGIQNQAVRMLSDPRASALGDNFAEQWLQLRKLALISPDPKIYPDFSESLRNSMKGETLAFFNHIVKEDRPITDFLDANYSFVDQKLAKLYGLTGSASQQFQKVDLTGTGRAGILSQASMLAVTSNPNRTSPVKRGKWILENILGTPPLPPPPGIGDLSEAKEAVEGLSLKERMIRHRKDPSCSSCHARMDAIGISMESYDAIGKRRSNEDDKGILPDGKVINGITGLHSMIVKQKQQFVQCFGSKLLTYALGRSLTSNDDCVLEQILKSAKANQYRFSSVVHAIVTSDAFRKIGN